MTQAEKMAEELLNKIYEVDYVDWKYDERALGIIRNVIQQVADQTRSEYKYKVVHHLWKIYGVHDPILEQIIDSDKWEDEEI